MNGGKESTKSKIDYMKLFKVMILKYLIVYIPIEENIEDKINNLAKRAIEGIVNKAINKNSMKKEDPNKV